MVNLNIKRGSVEGRRFQNGLRTEDLKEDTGVDLLEGILATASRTGRARPDASLDDPAPEGDGSAMAIDDPAPENDSTAMDIDEPAPEDDGAAMDPEAPPDRLQSFWANTKEFVRVGYIISAFYSQTRLLGIHRDTKLSQ